MTSKRLFWLLMGGMLLAVVGLVGSVYGVSNMLKAQSVTLGANKSTVANLEAEQAGLVVSKHDIVQYSGLESIAKSIVPQDKDQAEAVREITTIANANSVALTTITFSSSSLGVATAAPSTAATTPVAGAKSALSQLTPVKTIPGVYDLQITIGNNGNNTVSFDQLDAFLKGLENNRRTAEVSSLSIQPQATKSGQYVFTLIVNDYIKPAK